VLHEPCTCRLDTSVRACGACVSEFDSLMSKGSRLYCKWLQGLYVDCWQKLSHPAPRDARQATIHHLRDSSFQRQSQSLRAVAPSLRYTLGLSAL
jgi:hypothetical protein